MKSHKDVTKYLMSKCIGDSADDTVNGVVCPVCGDNYVHFSSPIEQDSRGNYEANWGGRGDLIIVPMECEASQHQFEICIGFHKGNVDIFARDTTVPEVFDQPEDEDECGCGKCCTGECEGSSGVI